MKNVLLFLSQGFEEAEASGFIDVCGWSRDTEGVTPVGLVVAGLHHEVKGAHSLTVKIDDLLSECNPADFVAFAIPGGYHERGFTEAYSPEVLDFMRAVYENGGYIASVCVGAKPIAEAGLLEGKEATTYPLDGGAHRAFLKEKGAIVKECEIVSDSRIVTSTGPATAFSVALRLFEMINGADDCALVRKAMRFDKPSV